MLLTMVVFAPRRSDGVDGVGAAGIAFDAVGSRVAGTVVEEGIEVGSIEVEAEAGADNGVLLQLRSWRRGAG